VQKLRRRLLDHEEFERDLRQLEDEAGLPAFYRSKPIPERMAAIGMSQAAIDHVSTWLDAIVRIASGRSDELPDNVKMNLPPTQTPNSLARNYWRVSFRATGRPEPSRSAGAPAIAATSQHSTACQARTRQRPS